MRNLLIVISFMVFTLSCGLFEDPQVGREDTPANPERSESDETGGQDTLRDEGTLDIGEVLDSNTRPEADEAPPRDDKSVTVRFGKGRTSRAYRDTVYGGQKHIYSFGVGQDQTISVRVSSADRRAYIRVYDPARKQIRLSEPSATSFSESVPTAGNYRIEVLTQGDGTDYTVSFGASALPVREEVDEAPRSGGITKTVRFSRGRSAATYRGAVIRGDRDSYLLGAKAGQVMSVSISSVENNAVFQIRGPRGYLQGAAPGSDRMSWSGRLPDNGRYRVIVGGTRGNATYAITFSIR